MTTMYINGKSVGSGKWKFSSIVSYCERKKIELKEAYAIISTCDYAYTTKLNLESKKYENGKETDFIAKFGISI